MRGIDPSVVLILIPVVFVGIVVVAFVGAKDETSRGDKIARFFGIASNAAIFFTVLALVNQVTASDEEAKRADYAEVLESYSEINRLQVEHPDVWRLMYPNEAQFALTGENERLAIQYTYFTLNFFERLYLLHHDGVIDDERWKAWDAWISYSLSTSPLFRDIWHESCGLHHTDFVAFIENTYDDGQCAPLSRQALTGTPAAQSQ